MDIINIILLIVVIFIFMVLRSVLGKRTGLEKSIVIDFKEKKNLIPRDKIEDKVKEPEIINLSQQSQEFSDEINLLEKNIVKILENENVAYDIGSYRSAPPGLRIWGGPTINPNDIKLLLPWLQWAFEDTYKLVKKGN